MKNNKPIKIFNRTNLNFTSIGVIVDQLNVYNINKELEIKEQAENLTIQNMEQLHLIELVIIS